MSGERGRGVTVWGIDLGTTQSAIARVDDAGRPEVIQNREGLYTTPSVVLFEPGTGIAVVGQEAKNETLRRPERSAAYFKRVMGVEGWGLEIDGSTWRPEMLSALILRKLAEDAEAATGDSVQSVVIAIPAYFNSQERAATLQAGELAGLTVLRIVNEPAAAAIYYSQLEKERGGTLAGNVLVYDLGGATFDVTIVWVFDEEITILATNGDHTLGGECWVDALVNHVAEQFCAAHGVDPRDDDLSLCELRIECEHAKCMLSNRESVKVSVRCQGKAGSVDVTLDEFEEITAHLLAQTIELTKECIEWAKHWHGAPVEAALLVGGASRMRGVGPALHALLGIEPLTFEPELAVAKGACMMAEWSVPGAPAIEHDRLTDPGAETP